jgi:hypothetical protein
VSDKRTVHTRISQVLNHSQKDFGARLGGMGYNTPSGCR